MNRPKVTLIMVQTLDGVIARDSNELIDWSSKEDKKHFFEKTKEIGCMIIGSSTFDTFPKPFTDRDKIILTRTPEKYKQYEEMKNLHFTSVENPIEALEYAKKLGYEHVALTGGSRTNTMFAEAGLIDEIYLTIEPKFFGQGLHLFSEILNMDLELLEIVNLNKDSILLHYNVIK